MSNYSGLQRFAYQKKAAVRYAPDSAQDSSVEGDEGVKSRCYGHRAPSSNRLVTPAEEHAKYLRKLYPDVPDDIVKEAVDHAETLDAAQTYLLRYLDARDNKRRKRIRVVSDSSESSGDDEPKRVRSANDSDMSNGGPVTLEGSADDPQELDDIGSQGSTDSNTAGRMCLSVERVAASPVVRCTSSGINEANERSNDEDETSAFSDVLKIQVVDFFNEAVLTELQKIPTCSEKRAAVIVSLRPFQNWPHLKNKILSTKHLGVSLIDNCWNMLEMRRHVTDLIRQCQNIAANTGKRVEQLLSTQSLSEEWGHVTEQPHILNPSCRLTHYQMIGLNWLSLMHNEKVNALLADEMGLGKTCQTIAFLAHLLESGERGPHIIIVPTSTLNNWSRELDTWCPSLKHLVYAGNQAERAELRECFREGTRDGQTYNILLTTYDFITSTAVDRSLYKKIDFHCAIFDEAHALKNMASKRYANLMKVQAKHRLLLTGTPVQNNLVELMSLMCFVMPHMFVGKERQLIKFFSSMSKNEDSLSKNSYESEQIANAKKIMEPFVLRRLKREILKELPVKNVIVQFCTLTGLQLELYDKLRDDLRAKVDVAENQQLSRSECGNMCMQLRKAANHGLLLRSQYDTRRLQLMAARLVKDPSHSDSDEKIVLEDMTIMSDFELHQLCCSHKCLSEFCLDTELIASSAKLSYLDQLLPKLKSQGDRVLMFSQFTSMMSILEVYLTVRGHSYVRLDGSTHSADRQPLIDRYNRENGIFVFLLSTKAGGVGINLTSANCVIIHDIDYNPYNDRQAEDRCHRLGQTRDVKVFRLVADGTIEIAMQQVATDKLKLDENIQQTTENLEDSIDFLRKIVGVTKHEQRNN